MLHVVTAKNKHEYRQVLEANYKARHSVFVEKRGWEELRKDDGREIDQFDNDDTTNLLFMDEDGKLLGGSRLTPSTRPNLLADVFPHLASMKPLPRSEKIHDWTRLYVNPDNRASSGYFNVAAQIQSGLIDYCLRQHIRKLTAVIDPSWIIRFTRHGLKPQALGMPVMHKGEMIVAVTLTISKYAMQRSRRLHHNRSVQLVQA